jgi:hypothetical protein
MFDQDDELSPTDDPEPPSAPGEPEV